MRAKDYLKLPYTRLIREISDESGHYYYGRILELDGCQSTGDTLDELETSLNEAMLGYLQACIKNKKEIPLPELESSYSGRFVLRIPKPLHQRLSVEARQEGVSLNQLALYKLAR